MNKSPMGFPKGREFVVPLGYPLGASEDTILPLAPPVSGMTGWWDASDFASLTIVSDLLSQWNDKSGNGNHATVGGGSSPGYGAARLRRIGGYVVPDFDRGDTVATAISGTGTTASIFFVAVGDLFNGQGSSTTIGGNEGRMLQMGDGGTGSDTDYGYFIFYGGSGFSTMPDPLGYAGRPFACGVTWSSGSALNMALNNTRFSTTNTAGTPSGVFQIGSRTGGQAWDGGIGEAILYNGTVLDSEQVNETMSYLMNKWGI